MASAPLLHYTELDAQFECDIADQHHELHHDHDEERLPPRPTSRLGFIPSPPRAPAPELPVTPWTKSLFQKIGIQSLTASSSDVDMDITAAPVNSPSADDDEDIDPLSLPILPSLSSASASTSSLNLVDMEVDTSSCESEYDDSDSDGYSSGGDSDIDLDSPADYGQGGRDILLVPPTAHPVAPPTLPLPALPPSIAPCTIPAPPSSFAQRPTPVPPPSPLPRLKFSCLPSPLAPNPETRIRSLTPLRHAYGHHGRSRHALIHFKYVWAVREDEWDEYNSCIREVGAYGGISATRSLPPPRRCPPPLRNLGPVPPPMPPMTIHPRRGDLAALHDPYCAHMDRCFVRTRVGNESDGASEDEGESEGESMAASISTASDASDETLVESECEGDGHPKEMVLVDANLEALLTTPRSRTGYTTATPKRSLAHGKSPLPPPPHWETSWYKRWELLIELHHKSMPPSPPAVRSPRFFIGDDDEQDDESWSEERWNEVLGDRPTLDDDDVMFVTNSDSVLLLEGI
ncbi:hypothetical protein C8J57DRAFT_1370865 [Mycena rebaudengoi]|nr:hypothetical protein C8J57DRAFT_1370865 [Mycena rebaudengoi]